MAVLTKAQRRMFDEIKSQGGSDGGAEYWPVVNDWVRDAGRAKALALRNINRTVAALVLSGYVLLDDEGMFRIVYDPFKTDFSPVAREGGQ